MARKELSLRDSLKTGEAPEIRELRLPHVRTTVELRRACSIDQIAEADLIVIDGDLVVKDRRGVAPRRERSND